LARRRGDYEQADMLLGESLALARALGHRRLICAILSERGELALARQQSEDASATWQEALASARATGNAELEAGAHYGLARAAAAVGDWSEALDQGKASHAIFEAIGHAQAPVVAGWLEEVRNAECGVRNSS
jgi:tetratricopeptide (TPR) repeat protein